MTDVQWLFAVLALLYSWECACWVRRGTVGFRTWWGRRWRALHPGTLLGNQRGGFVLAPPLPPLGTLLTSSQLPVSFSPEGVLAFVAPSVNPGGRPVQSANWVRFDEIRKVEASGKEVLINGKPFLKTASPGWAIYLADQLRKLSQSAPGKRAAAIEALIKRSLDPKAIERRWQEFQQRTAPLRWLPNLLFGYLFVAAPLLIWRFGIERCWLGLLVGLLGFTVTTAILFRRAHKYFYPEA
ncbi:MAG TPA: hypothetical protein VNZ22_15115, partial [Bacillota bacterium]|nr:hypothetical protein [Bacillota bacterium]